MCQSGTLKETPMKKALIAFAACAISALALSQPMDQRDGREMDHQNGDHRTMEQRDMEHRAMMERAMEQRNRDDRQMEQPRRVDRQMNHRDMHERRHARVWVRAHREADGRRVRGHYESHSY
jgi:hypothetical protein